MPEPRPRRTWAADAGWVLGTAVLLGLAAWWLLRSPAPRFTPEENASGRLERTVAPGEPEDYVGDAVCARCHSVEAQAHQASGHAHTYHRAANHPLAQWLAGRTVEDPEFPESRWSYRIEAGRLIASNHQASQTQDVALDLAMGSGEHAVTFVSVESSHDGHPEALEHRISLFPRGGEVDARITPGQTHQVGRDPEHSVLGHHLNEHLTHRCVECHTTLTSTRGGERLDPGSLIPQVSCERCHGPGREHAERAARHASARDLSMPFGPGQYSAEEQVRMCGDCHRRPDFAPKRDLWPGNPALVRFQPIGMSQSECYRQSAGSLRCTSCHDPHGPTMKDDRAYEASCLSCHHGPEETRCPVSPESGCIGCHMPRQTNAQGLTFTDHWIRVLKPDQQRPGD